MVTMVNILSTILVGSKCMMSLIGSLKTCLLSDKELSENEILALKDGLCSKTIQELRVLAKDVNVRLTGSLQKADIVERLVGMAQI